MNIKKNLGNKIRKIRLDKGLTQENLAEKINLSAKSLSQIELGNNFVSAETLGDLCKALDISPKTLFDFDEINDNKDTWIKEINSKIKYNKKLLKIVYLIVANFD